MDSARSQLPVCGSLRSPQLRGIRHEAWTRLLVMVVWRGTPLSGQSRPACRFSLAVQPEDQRVTVQMTVCDMPRLIGAASCCVVTATVTTAAY